LIEQALFGRQQRAAAVDVDAATLEDNLRVDQRELEALRRKHRDLVVFLPVLVLGPGIEMEARDGEPLRCAHEDRSEVTRPASVGWKAEKVQSGEIHADLLEYATCLSLLCRGVDQSADHFARASARTISP